MRRSIAAAMLIGVTCFPWATVSPAQAQEGDALGAGRGPQFLLAASQPSAPPVPVDAASVAVLRRRVSLDLEDVGRAEALAAISRASGLRLVYASGVVPREGRVRLKAEAITAAAALTEVLLDAGVDVILSSGGNAVLVRRTARAAPAVGSVSGRVTDAKTGQGLVGAEVLLERTRWRATTGEDGRYRLSEVEPGSYTLVVRRIGYGKQSQPVTVALGEEATADVALEPIPTQLDELVTTVTGEQRRLELGHVVGVINADSLVKEAPVSNLSELLNGRVPGLQVSQGQGTVGGKVNLQVRGPNSMLLGTQPIVVVDGVRYTGSTVEARLIGDFGTGPAYAEATSPLNDLNPNDVESIEVVKGPSAATLYGTDAANGVIVITTKRGRPGPARWNAYAKGTTSAIPTRPYPDSYWGWGTAGGVPVTSNCTLQSHAQGFCTQDSVTVLPNPLTDPGLSIFGNAPRREAGLSVSGGRQDLRYYFAGGFENAIGPLRTPPALAEQLQAQRGLAQLPDELRHPNTLRTMNLRANVTAALGEMAELRLNTGYIHTATRSLQSGGPYSGALSSARPKFPYGRSSDPSEVFSQNSTERTDRFVASASGQWRPAAWLVTRATVGLDLANRNRGSLARRGDTPRSPYGYANGAVQEDRLRQVATTAELGATATAGAGRLSLRTSVGGQYVRNLSDGLSSFGSDLPPGGTSVGQATNVSTGQTYYETVTLGSYLEETLGLNERLFLTGAVRVDGASAFGRDYTATVYPKASISWLVSQEPFVPHVPGLDELRLRYAYGASGQQPQPDWARVGFSAVPAVVNGTATTTVRLDALGNQDIRPERVREHEFGLDASALGRRAQLGLTWYRRRTADQIVAMNLPPGLGQIYTNLGLTTQRGFEAELAARLLDTRALSWDVRVQHSSHTTQLVALGGAAPVRDLFGGYVEGYPLGARFVVPLVGYADANGDGIITANEVQRGDSAVYAGESTPPHSQTFSTVIGLFQQRLRLSALLERRTGFTQLDWLKAQQCAIGRCRGAVDPGASPREQAEALAVGPSNVEPGDFTRLREVVITLDLPAGVARALRVGSATLSLAGRNLALWTEYSGPDPESASVNGARGNAAEGIPQARSWTIRLDLGF